MTRPGSRLVGHDALLDPHAICLTDKPTRLVGAEVRNQDLVPRGVPDDLVRMRGFLSVFVGSVSGKLEDLGRDPEYMGRFRRERNRDEPSG